MDQINIFEGLNIPTLKKVKPNESYFSVEELLSNNDKNLTADVQTVNDRGFEFYEEIAKTTHAIFKELVLCIEKRLNPTSDSVQAIIKRHHKFTTQIHSANKEVYKGLALMYREDEDFKSQLEPFHPQLAEFMAEAMVHYADRELY